MGKRFPHAPTATIIHKKQQTTYHRTSKEQPDFFNIPSPCIGVCEANAKGYCKGCLRSREERLYWLDMTDEQKHQVMRLIGMRKTKIRNRKLELLERPDNAAPEQGSFDF